MHLSEMLQRSADTGDRSNDGGQCSCRRDDRSNSNFPRRGQPTGARAERPPWYWPSDRGWSPAKRPTTCTGYRPRNLPLGKRLSSAPGTKRSPSRAAWRGAPG